MKYIAVVGCGNISRAHIEGLKTFPDRCCVAALVDIYPDKAREKKEQFSLEGAKVYASLDEMLKDGVKIDLAHICTPPYTHAELAISCMNAGLSVLVEKPMATCLKECDEMLEAQARNGVMLSVIAQNRFRNDVCKMRELAHSGIAGKVRVAHVNSLWWRGHCYYDLWWRGTWEKEGGGPTLNHAVHHIDMLNWIQGEPPVEVTAVLGNVMHDNSEVEDISFAALRYNDNSLALVTSSVVHHGEEQGIVLQCEKAKIEIPFHVMAEISRDNGFAEPNKPLIEEITAKYNEMPELEHKWHTGQVDDVLRALETGGMPAITGTDGKGAVELITAIYKSGCLKQTVTLPISRDDAYYTFEGILKNAVKFYKKAKSVEKLGDSQITFGNAYRK